MCVSVQSKRHVSQYPYIRQIKFVIDKLQMTYISVPNAMHGQFRLLSPGKASSHSTALPRFFIIFFPVCNVFVIHRTLTWTTGIFNVRTWSFLPTSQHNILTRKNSHTFTCAPDTTGFELRSLDLESMRCSTNELSRLLCLIYIIITFLLCLIYYNLSL